MPTLKQRIAVKEMLENGGVVSRAMEKAGYRPAVSKNPDKLTKSKGFQQLCDEAGLTQQLIITSLTEDIKKKPQRRVGELNLGADILGLKKQVTNVIPIQVNIEKDRAEFE